MADCDLGKYIMTAIIKGIAERVNDIKYPDPNNLKGSVIHSDDFDNLIEEMLSELED